MYYLGLDIGSVSVKLVLINMEGGLVHHRYLRHKGRPLEAMLELVREIESLGYREIKGSGVTGTGAYLVSGRPGIMRVNEIIAHARSVAGKSPQVRTIIEVGGEDSKLILLEHVHPGGAVVVTDFAMNTMCAAGTGSFLDQQASRLGVSIEEEFGSLAMQSRNPPRIAGRCSVFAKSDMIHLQQKATPDYDIVAGLCFAMARNFVSTISKGKTLAAPIAFHGGVAANAGMVRAFKEVLEIGENDLVIPATHAVMGALGAALTARDQGPSSQPFPTSDELESLQEDRSETAAAMAPLGPPASSPVKILKTAGENSPANTPCIAHPDPPVVRMSLDSDGGADVPARQAVARPAAPSGVSKNKEGRIDTYLGVDIGSISTNVVALSADGRVLSKRYLMTAGRPIEAVRQGLREVGGEVAHLVNIRGVCTTGSGRYLIADLIGADMVKNEITAQARAAAAIDPTVDTIFEIGGQDSKYISLENGAVVDFEMNKVCAAGTGSFIEEQAEKLGISIKQEFGSLALAAAAPVRLGERCTVFMESDLTNQMQKGADTDNLVGGLAYSIVYNYLNRVVGDKKVGGNIFFQGGVAANRGVVAAFEKVTGRPITVPEHHEVTGAIGCAMIAREYMQGRDKSSFKGFDLSERAYELSSFECRACPNRCEINKVAMEGEPSLFYGGRCEKYERRVAQEDAAIPDLFAERDAFLYEGYNHDAPPEAGRKVVGIPRILHLHEYFPFWSNFFKSLGFAVRLSSPTNRTIITQGVEAVLSETCFPIKIAHGHVMDLQNAGVDYIFLPSVLNMKIPSPLYKESVACPYVQSIPYTINAALDLDQGKVKMLQPVVEFGKGRKRLQEALRGLARKLGCSRRQADQAMNAAETAQENFYLKLRRRGEEVLTSITERNRALVVIGRPYNSCDPGVNLDLARKLRDLRALPMPMDFLPLDDVELTAEWSNLTWRYGQRIMAAGEIVRRDHRLNAVYITNFGCGPDSFLLQFFRRKLGGKNFLVLEIDEHNADAGLITRCEAFLDSLENVKERVAPYQQIPQRSIKPNERRTVYIPNMCDHAFALSAAFKAYGVPSEVVPHSDAESLEWGRKHCSGKECFPCIVTTGDFLKVIHRPDFDPDRAAFFMPTAGGGCRFGYYNMLQRMVLDEIGRDDVPIFSPNQNEDFYSQLGLVGSGFARTAWEGLVAVDMLEKAAREVRPYEVKPGTTDQVYRHWLDRVCETMVSDKGDLVAAMVGARRDFEAVKVDRSAGRRPRIGVVGEIFVRMHAFSNDNIVRRLEDLGAEVWVAPFTEWVFYINYLRRRQTWRDREFKGLLESLVEDRVQHMYENRLARPWEGFLSSLHEPSAARNVEMGSPYLDPSFEGEAIMSMGKASDYVNRGISGIVNVMPFTCMPGTVVSAVMNRFRKDHGNVPVLNMAYDGVSQATSMVRLEAFVHQCRQFMLRRDSGDKTAAREVNAVSSPD